MALVVLNKADVETGETVKPLSVVTFEEVAAVIIKNSVANKEAIF
jgi:hypothetical protein